MVSFRLKGHRAGAYQVEQAVGGSVRFRCFVSVPTWIRNSCAVLLLLQLGC